MQANFSRLKKTIQAKWYIVLIVILFLGGFAVRFVNYENRLIFGPEQGMSLITSASNLEKFSFLGETNLIRATSAGHILFHGAVYSYLILPLLILFNFRVLPITISFALLNLLTAFVLFLVAKKIFGKFVAILSLFFFLFSDVMVHHSLFPWIVNPTPLLGVLTLWLFYIQIKNRDNLLPSLLIGVMSGVGFGMQNFYLFFVPFQLMFTLLVSKKRLLGVGTFIFGIILGSFPTVIFDLRHDFYHVRTFWQFFREVLAGSASGTSTYYNFLFLYPYLFIIYAFLAKLLYKISKPLILIPIIYFLFVCITSPMSDLINTKGMAPGMSLSSLETAASLIARDNPPSVFNVATLWDFDTRAHPLRYLLQFYYGLKSQPYENYQSVDALYVLAPESYDMEKPRVWELQTFMPYIISDMNLSVPNFRLYKLTNEANRLYSNP